MTMTHLKPTHIVVFMVRVLLIIYITKVVQGAYTMREKDPSIREQVKQGKSAQGSE